MKQGFSKLAVATMLGFATVSAGVAQRQSSCCAFLPEVPVATDASESSLLVQEGGALLSKGGRFTGTRSNQRNQYATLRAYREAIGDQWKTTVQIFDSDKQLALGTIVRSDGWIATKSSELPDSPIDVRLFDGSRATGKVKVRRPESDLALLKIERSELPAIRWNPDAQVPVGGWLASADSRALPLALGVVSVRSRTIHQEKPVLGIQLSIKKDVPYIESVVTGSGADKAGLREGDVIKELDQRPMQTSQEVLEYLKSISAGSRLNIVVDRDGNEVALMGQMMDLSMSLLDPTEMEVNGSISARSTGFRDVIQHDTVLAPNDCGGPLIDVDGNAVGLNIARAGRICSYALPAKVVDETIGEMLQSVAVANELPRSEASGLADNKGITVEVLKPDTSAQHP